jgi:16S rRNA (cytosine967-C5)-methyltransferase
MNRPASTRHPGLAARQWAALAVRRTLRERRSLDEALTLAAPKQALADGDRGLARAIATVTFRRLGTIRRALSERLLAGAIPSAGLFAEAMETAIAQILFLDVPDHAAVDVAVELCKQDADARHYAKLANAVLRRVVAERADILADTRPGEDSPPWLLEKWGVAYGADEAMAIAEQHAKPPTIDLTVFDDAAGFAAEIGGLFLPTGSVRLQSDQTIPDLPGYAEGRFQVQDAASALPARLFGDLTGKRVLDLCAAPGGKTAQLIRAGATVTAVERSAARADRLRGNLERLRLVAEIHVQDALEITETGFDAVLLDAPCSATGTIRRHPEIAWSKTRADILGLAAQQARLLDHAATCVRPGGMLVYATCSLEPEEGERQIAAFLDKHPEFRIEAVDAAELGLAPAAINADGCLRLLPHLLSEVGGVDGFFAAKLIRLT